MTLKPGHDIEVPIVGRAAVRKFQGDGNGRRSIARGSQETEPPIRGRRMQAKGAVGDGRLRREEQGIVRRIRMQLPAVAGGSEKDAIVGKSTRCQNGAIRGLKGFCVENIVSGAVDGGCSNGFGA